MRRARTAVLGLALTACGARTGLIVEPPSVLVDAASPVDASVVPPSACEWPPATLVVQLTDGSDHTAGDAVAIGGRVLLALREGPAGSTVRTQWIGSLGERLAGPSAPVTPVGVRTTTPRMTLSIAADGSGPRGLLASDVSGPCAFVPLAGDGGPGVPVYIDSVVSCRSLHARPGTLFDLLYADPVTATTIDLALLDADGAFVMSRALGPVTLPLRAARAFRDDGSSELAWVEGPQLFAQPYTAGDTATRSGVLVADVPSASSTALVATPQGFVVVVALGASGPPTTPLETASIALDGALGGAARPLAAAFDTVGPGDAIAFDLAYSNGDVLLAEVRPGAVAGTNDLDFATLTLDGVPRAAPMRLTSAMGLAAPRIVATSVGVVIVFDARAADGSTQVFSIGLNCLR